MKENKMLKDYSTKELYEELEKRGGVDRYFVHPYDELNIKMAIPKYNL